jgi:hypothetical protein
MLPTIARAQDAVAKLESAVNSTYLKTFGEVIPTLLSANAKLEEARGNKVKADSLRALAEDVQKGASKPNGDKAELVLKALNTNATAMSANFSAQAAAISKDQMATFIAGAVDYFKGTKGTVELASSLGSLTEAVSGVSGVRNPMQLGKIRSLLSIAKVLSTGIPSTSNANIQAATALKNYVTANKISIPAAQMSFQ